MNGESDVVSWSRPASASVPGRLCLCLQAGVFGGLAVIVVALVAGVVVPSITSGEYESLALVILLALVGGPFSILYLLPLAIDPEQRPSLGGPLDRADYGSLPRSWIAASIVVVTAAMGGSIALHPLAWLAILVGSIVVGFGATGLVAPDGRIDPDTRTLRVGERTFDLDDLTAVRTRRLGTFVFLRPAFANETTWVTAPAILSMPLDAYEAAEPVFEAAVEAETEPKNPPDRAERVALAVFGIGALAGTVGLVALGATRGGDAAAVLYGVAPMVGLFGVVFLALAVRNR